MNRLLDSWHGAWLPHGRAQLGEVRRRSLGVAVALPGPGTPVSGRVRGWPAHQLAIRMGSRWASACKIRIAVRSCNGRPLTAA